VTKHDLCVPPSLISSLPYPLRPSCHLVHAPNTHTPATRALLADPSRTLNPWEADLFFVPAYLQVSSALSNRAGSGRSVTKPQHQKRIGNWIAALQASPWFRRHGGADHLFSVGDLNPGWSAAAGMPQVKAVLHRGYTGTFEMNGAWSGDWDVNRMIAMP